MQNIEILKDNSLEKNEKLVNYFRKSGVEVKSHGGFYIWSKKGYLYKNDSILIGNSILQVTSGEVFGQPLYFRTCSARTDDLLNQVIEE